MQTTFYVIFLLLPLIGSTIGYFEGCDKTVNLAAGQYTYVNSPNYPNAKWPSGSSCRWHVNVPAGYAINIECNINVDSTKLPQCTSEYLYIGIDGNKNGTGAEYFCGSGYLSRTSLFNTLLLAYTSNSAIYGGIFSCLVTAIEPPCDCGWDVKTRIVGGRPAKVNEFTSMAGIVDLSTKKIFCGGTIIHFRYVLSSAHCFVSRVAGGIAIVVGEHDINTGTETSYTALYTVAQIIRHEAFNVNTMLNDIALLKTSTVIAYSRAVGPACLPFLYSLANFEKQTVKVVGWGTTSFGGPTSTVLRTADLQVQPQSQCVTYHPKLATTQMCTYTAGRDSCQNDSGGPAYWFYSRYYVVGIISHGIACGTKTPAINTRITSYLNWIKTKTPDAKYCSK